MIFNHAQIKTVNLNFNNGFWNAKTHNLILSYDPKQPTGIVIRPVPIEDDITPIIDFTQANEILNKFRKIK